MSIWLPKKVAVILHCSRSIRPPPRNCKQTAGNMEWSPKSIQSNSKMAQTNPKFLFQFGSSEEEFSIKPEENYIFPHIPPNWIGTEFEWMKHEMNYDCHWTKAVDIRWPKFDYESTPIIWPHFSGNPFIVINKTRLAPYYSCKQELAKSSVHNCKQQPFQGKDTPSGFVCVWMSACDACRPDFLQAFLLDISPRVVCGRRRLLSSGSQRVCLRFRCDSNDLGLNSSHILRWNTTKTQNLLRSCW